MRRALVALGAALILAAAGCSDDDDPQRVTPTPTPSFDADAAEAEIRANWEAFFDSSRPRADRLSYLQSATSVQDAVRAQRPGATSPRVRAVVRDIVVARSRTQATVTFDLLIRERVFIPSGAGTAVLDDGTWKVSKATFCNVALIVTRAGPRDVPGCS